MFILPIVFAAYRAAHWRFWFMIRVTITSRVKRELGAEPGHGHAFTNQLILIKLQRSRLLEGAAIYVGTRPDAPEERKSAESNGISRP